MFEKFFNGWDVNSDYKQELITLWPAPLGKENLHLLENVTQNEWARFNNLIELIAQKEKVGIADCQSNQITFPENIKSSFSDYTDSMNKSSDLFSKYVLPDLECIITEEWDYTYILWYKKDNVVKALSPLIIKAGLKHFSGW